MAYKQGGVSGTITQYDVLVGDTGSSIASVGPGTSGQVLQSGGNAANPSYSTSTYPSTNASGDILYGSASNVWSSLAKPSTIGSKLIYDGSNLYWYDPSKDLYMEDDFVAGNIISETGWKSSTSGSGAAVNCQNKPTLVGASNPGIVYCDSGTTASGYAGIITAQNNNQAAIWLGGGSLDQYWIVKLAQTSVSTDRFNLMVGMMSFGATPTVTAGVWFGYIDDVNSGKWTINCAGNGSTTTTNSTSDAVAASTWYNLHINVNAAASLCTFYVNGVSVGTVATNIPTTTGNNSYSISPSCFIASTTYTSVNKVVAIDKHILFQKMTSSR